jgi:hypothetical protein
MHYISCMYLEFDCSSDPAARAAAGGLQFYALLDRLESSSVFARLISEKIQALVLAT